MPQSGKVNDPALDFVCGTSDFAATDSMKACVIFNPVARGDKARHFKTHLDEVAQEASLKPTTCAGDARRLAAEAVREGFDTVVAAGGDGTLNEVLNGIVDAEGFAKTRLAVLPLGTVNVFAKELKLPQDFMGAWKIIQQGKETTIDAPWADYVVEGTNKRRYFAQMAGAGLDSRAVELVNWELKKRFGFLSYVVAGFQALNESLPPIEVSNGTETASGQLILIGNGKFYGGRFTVFPLADLCDGVLEAVIYPRVTLVTAARSGWGMLTDDFHTRAGTIQLRGPQLQLKCAAPIPFQLDGENVAPLPVTFGVNPRALRVMVP
jgi:diacylglycerol kinase (ATP)